MATNKKRINITANPEIESAIKRAAKRDGVPVAAKASELIEIGLNLEEDMSLAGLASLRDQKGARYVSHQDAWSK
ncbi:MAG: hypothetical protein HYV68_00065 [Candidatus Taylorbacteria bacterium]|nr:hypothetical protein [Candidatus Taylorbacteria bacterium]